MNTTSKPIRLLIPVFSPATGTWGGLTRVLAVAQAAESAGHRVAFVASGSLAGDLRRHGYPVYPAPAPNLFGLPRPVARILERRSQRVTLPVPPGKSVGDLGLVYLLSGLAQTKCLRREVKAGLGAVADFQPDALFTDLNPGAYILARITRSPIAAAFQGVMLQRMDSLAWKVVQRAESRVLYVFVYMGEVDQFTPEWLRNAFERRREFAAQAAILGEQIESYGGPRQAVRAIEAHAKWAQEAFKRA